MNISTFRKLAASAFAAGAMMLGGAAYAAPAADIVEASKSEGRLLIYSNMAAENWDPIVKGFNSLYPWITVETLNFNASEAITRYRAESGSNVPSADFIVTGAISDWIRFADDKLAADYISSEDASVPAWSKPFPGIYTFSTDPMGIAYNKIILDEKYRPDSFEAFKKVVVENPGLFKGKIGAYPADAFGGAINMAFVRYHGDKGWQMLDAIGPSVKPGDGSGAIIEKLSRGENVAGYFMSAPSFLPKLKGGLGSLIEYKYLTDGTPVFIRGMAIPAKATHGASAKLMLDFILSEQGQIAVSQAGFTPYRDGLPRGQLRFDSLETLGEKIGKNDIVLIDYNREMLTSFDAFAQRWADAMGRN